MWFKICFLLSQYIFYNQYEFVNAKAMVGKNVRQAEEGEFPFIASIKLINNQNLEPENDHGCTGVLISGTSVLSVSHGIVKVSVEKLEVVLGSIDIRCGRKFFVKNFITFDQWAVKKNIMHLFENTDIAILKLTTTVPVEIKPVTLSNLPLDSLYGLDVIIAGWGKGINNKVSRFMKTSKLKILTKLECKDRIERFKGSSTTIHEKFLCSSANPNVFLRGGDSGGPLLTVNGELIGINRASCPPPEDNLDPNKVNIHIPIEAYKEFIEVVGNH